MGRAEALSVLGLAEGASEAEIRAVHRRLMRSAHPDHGGSDWIAARLNEARDVLLG
jgi:curved DNA-binding protein CbpA